MSWHDLYAGLDIIDFGVAGIHEVVSACIVLLPADKRSLFFAVYNSCWVVVYLICQE